MDETLRRVAWSIAEAWWRKKNRVAAGSVPEANSSAEYADNFWQGWAEEGTAALRSVQQVEAERSAARAVSAIIPRI
jgi:hypothetical protein